MQRTKIVGLGWAEIIDIFLKFTKMPEISHVLLSPIFEVIFELI